MSKKNLKPRLILLSAFALISPALSAEISDKNPNNLPEGRLISVDGAGAVYGRVVDPDSSGPVKLRVVITKEKSRPGDLHSTQSTELQTEPGTDQFYGVIDNLVPQGVRSNPSDQWLVHVYAIDTPSGIQYELGNSPQLYAPGAGIWQP